MKIFRISAVLGLAMALSPAGAFADDEPASPVVTPLAGAPTAAAAEETNPVVEEAPALDLVFCIDCSGSMGGYMPVLKPTIRSIIRHAVQQNPGRTLRLGLVRYGNGDKRYLVLDLTEDQNKFLDDLQYDKFLGAQEYVGDIIKKSVENLKWSKNGVRRLYVIGNESAEQGSVSLKEALSVARSRSVSISTAYCSIAPNARPQASDLLNVKSWFGNEWQIKSTWIDLARLGGGDYIQIVSPAGGVLPGVQPLLAVGWDGITASRFATYLVGAAVEEQAQQARFQRAFQSLNKPGRTVSFGSTPVEHSVLRYYEMNPQAASYLLRP